MLTKCPDCGAQLDEGNSCQSIFDLFLALEFTDPKYGKVHFLTVVCFMVQHNHYSDDALPWIQEKLRLYFEQAIPIEKLRDLAAQDAGSEKRSWKILRHADASPLPRIAWTMTIAEVAANAIDAESYCDLIKKWGNSTLKQMAALPPCA